MEPSDQPRVAILDAAEQLFVRYGFKKTSIDDVARAARIGKGSVYLHFSSKEELFAEVVRRTSDGALEAVATAVARARTPAEKLRAFIDTSSEVLPGIAAEHHVSEETMTELISLGMAVRPAHLARQRSMLVELLRAGVASGAFEVERTTGDRVRERDIHEVIRYHQPPRPAEVKAQALAWLENMGISTATKR